MDMLTCPMGKLPNGRLGAVKDGGDLVVRHSEDLAQYEDGPFGRGKSLKHDEHRDRDLPAALGMFGYLRADIRGCQKRLRKPRTRVALAPRPDRPQPVECQPRCDPGEEGAWIGYVRTVTGRPAEPGLLNDILGVGDATQHVVGDAEEQRSMQSERVSHAGTGHRSLNPWLARPRALLNRER